MTSGLAPSCPAVLTSLRTISREATKPADAKSFFLPILALSALAYGPQCFFGYRKDYRMDYWLRLLFQPIFIIWALFVAGVLWNSKER
jgi:hypothetical protein